MTEKMIDIKLQYPRRGAVVVSEVEEEYSIDANNPVARHNIFSQFRHMCSIAYRSTEAYCHIMFGGQELVLFYETVEDFKNRIISVKHWKSQNEYDIFKVPHKEFQKLMDKTLKDKK